MKKKKGTREIPKETPLGASRLGQVIPGDSAELTDGRLVQVAWWADDLTMVRFHGDDGPGTGSPTDLPSSTPIVTVRRKERRVLADGRGFDPLGGRS